MRGGYLRVGDGVGADVEGCSTARPAKAHVRKHAEPGASAGIARHSDPIIRMAHTTRQHNQTGSGWCAGAGNAMSGE